MFPLKTRAELLTQAKSFDPVRYARTRNYIKGNVSQLSPYITHGIVSTKDLVGTILQKYSRQQAEKFLMELVWKEFFLQVQREYGNDFLDQPIWQDKTGITKKSLLPHSLHNSSTTS
jgi:deoxyribodipyrimidine photo-lyase